MGLNCPNATSLEAFNAAVARGDITYHAFPFNSELEMYDPVFIEAGIKLTHSLDALYGLDPKVAPLSRSITQRPANHQPEGCARDDPQCHSFVARKQSDCCLLAVKDYGVLTILQISVGVNGASTPPYVPNV